MNKQEVIEAIENERTNCDDTIWGGAYDEAIDDTLAIVRQLDEPEKPVVPQFVAEYIEYCKRDKFYALHGAYNNMDNRLKCWRFNGNNSELFAKAWLYGYEVEKEKLYTVKFSNEDFGKIYIGIFKAVNKLGISSLPLNDDDVKSWFTEDELKRFKFWNNPAFEIREVEE